MATLGMVKESPVIGAADHLYNNSIGQCPETRYICSAQITPPPRTLLDVSPRFSPDSVDNQHHSHTMTEARPRKQGEDAKGSVDNGWLSTGSGWVPAPLLHPAEQSAGAFCRPLACVSSARRLTATWGGHRLGPWRGQSQHADHG